MKKHAESLGALNSARVNINNPTDRDLWAQKLQTDVVSLTEAVRRAGPSLMAVSQQLRLQKPDGSR